MWEEASGISSLRVRLLSAALVALLSVLGLASATAAQAPAGDTIVIAIEGEPNNLNPIFGDVFGSFNGDHWPIFTSLLDYNKQTELAPTLADGMPEVSEDGLNVTVRVREDAQWHDGEPVTAADVVFTYQAMLDPDVATGLRDLLFESLAEVSAPDERTVNFRLSRRDPAFLDKLTIGIVPQHLLEGQDLNTARFNVESVGSGPFVFSEFVEGERLVMTANPDYFGGEVGIPRIVFVFINDENTRVARLEAGEIDVDAVGLTPRIAERFRDSDRYDIVRVPGEQLSLQLPTHNPVLGDERVRQAIGLAIDRPAFVSGLFGDFGRPAYSAFQPQHWAYDPSVEFDQDMDQVRALLAEAGWRPGADGILERQGTRLSFEFLHSSDPLSQNAAVALRDALAEVGVEARLEVSPSFEETTRRVAETGAVTIGRPGNAYDPDLYLFRDFHSSSATDDDPATNRNRIADDQVDAAIEAGRTSTDLAERRSAYAQLQQALQDNGAVQYLGQRDYLLIVSKNIQGIDPGTLDGHLHGWSRGLMWNLAQWRLG